MTDGHSEKARPLIWSGVPARNPNLVRRKELFDKLGEIAISLPFESLPIALHGVVGAGKTQLAAEFVYQNQHRYKIVCWIQASQPSSLTNGLLDLSRQLGIDQKRTTDETITLLKDRLRTYQGGRWLLVFDNAKNPESILRLLPTSGSGDILITSRNPGWKGVARTLEVPALSDAESSELLRSRNPQLTEKEAVQLAHSVGNLPLALTQVAVWQEETGTSTSEYLRLFNQYLKELFNFSSPADFQSPLFQIWQEESAELAKTDPLANSILQLSAFLDAQAIPRALFAVTDDDSISPQLKQLLHKPLHVSQAIRTINNFGLSTVNNADNTFSVNPFVQWLTKTQMTSELRTEVRENVHRLIAHFTPENSDSAENWLAYEAILPHANAAEVADVSAPETEKLVLDILEFLNYPSSPADERLARKATELWQNKYGASDSRTIAASATLWFTLWKSGRYKEAQDVFDCYGNKFDQASQDGAENFPIKSNVALALRTNGKFAAARALDQEVYDRTVELFGMNHPRTIRAGNNLSVALRVNGEYQRALHYSDSTYQIQQKMYGTEGPDALNTRAGRAVDRRELGDYIWAKQEQTEILAIAQAVLGEFHFDTLYRMHQLAVVTRKCGEYGAALKLSQTANHEIAARYGQTNHKAFSCLVGHSLDLKRNGDLTGSRRHGEQAIELFAQQLGADHPHTLTSTINVATTLRILGNHVQAKKLAGQALEKLRSGIGDDHPHTIMSMINQATTLCALGELSSALPLEEEAIERSQRVLGLKHPTTLVARANHILNRRSSQDEQVEDLYPQVLADFHEALGSSHPLTAAVSSRERIDCDIDTLVF